MDNNEKLQPVVTGETKVKRKTFLEKFGDIILEEKDPGTVGEYLCKDIVKPTIKKFIYEMVTETLSQLLYGGSAPNSTRTTGTYVNYKNQYVASRPSPQVTNSSVVSGIDVFSFEKIMFSSKSDALAVLDQMYDLLGRYDLVRVSQFYDLSNYTTDNTQAYKFGWIDLSGAEVVRDFSGGYYIKLPKPYPLD